MTVFGGEETTWGTKKNGFFVTCCRCGWHSKISINHEDIIGFKYMIISCGHCGNEYKEEITDKV